MKVAMNVCNSEHWWFCFPTGVALLANAPERLPEKKKRGREKEASTSEPRPLPPVGSGGKQSSRAARQRIMMQREEQLAAQKVLYFMNYWNYVLYLQLAFVKCNLLDGHLLPTFQLKP